MKKYFEKLYKNGAEEFYDVVKENLKNNKKMLIVTANPETFIMGTEDVMFNKLLLDKDVTVIPDGIGIVKGANLLQYKVKERIPGVELVEKLLFLADKYKKSLYLYGSKQEVIDSMSDLIHKKFSNIKLIGAKNGYTRDKNKDFLEIVEKKPDIILVALGMKVQEQLIYENFSKAEKGIFVGVGGSFDVLSGSKKRAPLLFQKLNLEWLYRIVIEPKRIKRFFLYNIKFLFKIISVKK